VDPGKSVPPQPAKRQEPSPGAKGSDATQAEPKSKVDPPAPGLPILGLFRTKDLDKQTLTVVVGGKDRSFRVTKDTRFIGPKGARSDDRLKDDRLDKGYQIVVVPAAKDVDLALEVKLSPRLPWKAK
jgi:hypothetical protein